MSVWDLEREQPLALPEATAAASSATLSPDGRKLAFGCLNGSVTVVDFPSAQVEEQFQLVSPVTCLAFSPDGRFLGIVDGSTARVRDCRTRTYATRKLCHPAAIDVLAFDPSGKRLATACQDGRCRVFAIAQDFAEPLFTVPHESKRPAVVPGAKATMPVFAGDGRYLVTRNEKDLLWWNADSGASVRSVRREYMTRMSRLPERRRYGGEEPIRSPSR